MLPAIVTFLAAWLLMTALAAPCRGQSNKDYNVVFIVVDSLRADHLSCYGYERTTSPYLDELASQAVRFERCFTQAPQTPAAVSSLFTSLHASSHSVHLVGEDRLPDEAVTLAEILKGQGVVTQGFVANNALKSAYGFAQGFDEYNDESCRIPDSEKSFFVANQAINWLGENRNKRFFLFLFFLDPHVDYTYHEGYSFFDDQSTRLSGKVSIKELIDKYSNMESEDLKTLIGYYDGEIKLTDDAIGQVLKALRNLGMLDNTIIVVTADHGEPFLDHGVFGHGVTLYNDTLRVPLLMRVPGMSSRGAVVDDVVSSIDIMPTLLRLLAVPGEFNVQGSDISAVFQDAPGDAGRGESLAETWVMGGFRQAMQDKDWKILYNKDGKGEYYQLFNLALDPQEQSDLASSEPDKLAEYQAKLSAFRERMSAVQLQQKKATLSPGEEKEQTEKLRALGYMQ